MCMFIVSRMFSIHFLVIVSWTVVAAYSSSPSFDLRIHHYKVDTTRDLVIQRSRPRFSWKVPTSRERHVQQVAYQLQIKSTTYQWDSQRIESNRSTTEADLRPVEHYQCRLCLWTTESHQPSIWTAWIPFRTTLFDLHEYVVRHMETVHWIGSDEIYMNELRKEFHLPWERSIRTATVLISGIGCYELYINGRQVDPSRKLDPGWTTYERRTLFATFDVKSFVQRGKNAVGVKLGNGWYSQEQYLLSPPNGANYGPPRLYFVMNITLSNGEQVQIGSDSTWQGRQGSIQHDSLYNGEIVDARLDRPNWSKPDFIDSLSLWLTPNVMPSPVNLTLHGQFTLQDMPPIRMGHDALHTEIQDDPLEKTRILRPVHISSPVSGVHVVDMGQNMVGWCRVRFRGARGISVQIRHAEILNPPVVSTGRASGAIYTDNLRSATQTDMYILRGDLLGEVYEPRFTVHGFRYLTIFGSPHRLLPDDIECPVVHSETTVKGHFSSSNRIINQIQHNIQWGQLNNLMSIPTDCPQRDERKGWLGDAALTVDEALYNFDLIRFYLNFLRSITDIQQQDGSIPDTVPFTSGSYPADPNWGTALPTIVWQLYRHYRDVELLRDSYAPVRAYIESVRFGYNRTGLVKLDYHYGDWVPPPPASMTDVHLISSFAFLHDLWTFVNMSIVLEMKNDTDAYLSFYQQLAEEFHRVFFHPTNHSYADGQQSAQILALALPHVVPVGVRDDVLDCLVKDIRARGNHFTTGIISTAQLFPVLSDSGYHDLAVELISSISYPSYGYMFNNPYENATTLWELWDAPFEGPEMNSRNHIMFGSVGAWFYSHLAGIDFQSDLILIRPRMISESAKALLSKVRCQLNTIHGLVQLSYTRDEQETFANSIRLTVVIPSNARARLTFEPLFHNARCVMLTEGNEIIWSVSQNEATAIIDEQTGLVTVEIDSGQYDYQAFWV